MIPVYYSLSPFSFSVGLGAPCLPCRVSHIFLPTGVCCELVGIGNWSTEPTEVNPQHFKELHRDMIVVDVTGVSVLPFICCCDEPASLHNGRNSSLCYSYSHQRLSHHFKDRLSEQRSQINRRNVARFRRQTPTSD